jgi:hypothetical protein
VLHPLLRPEWLESGHVIRHAHGEMVGRLILASISRCVSVDLCPTDEDILAAVRARDAEIADGYTIAASQEEPNGFVHYSPQRIRRISDVICGDALPGETPTITCKFTVRYWSTNAFQVARLVQEGKGWRIDEALSVSRKRR